MSNSRRGVPTEAARSWSVLLCMTLFAASAAAQARLEVSVKDSAGGAIPGAAVAVLSAQRTPELPDGPTFAEAGLPGVEMTTWYGLFVTAGTRDRERMFKGYETGAVDFLFKPIEPHVLKGKADVALCASAPLLLSPHW